jgi:hypothetical protein
MNKQSKNDSMDRREFLLRTAKAGASVAAAGMLGYWLYDTTVPSPSENGNELVRLRDFSVPGIGGRMSIVTGRDRIQTVNRAVKAIGGIETFITKGDRVLFKVNAAFATPPMLSATTNPQLVSEVARLCFKAGASSVVVTDNPINDPTSCFNLTGIARAAGTVGARVFLPKEGFFQPTTVQGGTLISAWPLLYVPFKGINKVIGIAPIKDHHRTSRIITEAGRR